MQDPITKEWVENVTCKQCRHRHPEAWSCAYATAIASGQKVQRLEMTDVDNAPVEDEASLLENPPRHTGMHPAMGAPYGAVASGTVGLNAERWETGNDDDADGDAMATAGIHITSGDHPHGNAIEFYGDTLALAQARRDAVLTAMQPAALFYTDIAARMGMSASFGVPIFTSPAGTHKLNNDHSVAVSTDVFWNEDMTTCPRGVKVQLLGRGGCAIYGTYDGKDLFYIGWAPVPRRRPR